MDSSVILLIADVAIAAISSVDFVSGQDGMRFANMCHGHNERIPVDGLRWGTETLAHVLLRLAVV